MSLPPERSKHLGRLRSPEAQQKTYREILSRLMIVMGMNNGYEFVDVPRKDFDVLREAYADLREINSLGRIVDGRDRIYKDDPVGIGMSDIREMVFSHLGLPLNLREQPTQDTSAQEGEAQTGYSDKELKSMIEAAVLGGTGIHGMNVAATYVKMLRLHPELHGMSIKEVLRRVNPLDFVGNGETQSISGLSQQPSLESERRGVSSSSEAAPDLQHTSHTPRLIVLAEENFGKQQDNKFYIKVVRFWMLEYLRYVYGSLPEIRTVLYANLDHTLMDEDINPFMNGSDNNFVLAVSEGEFNKAYQTVFDELGRMSQRVLSLEVKPQGKTLSSRYRALSQRMSSIIFGSAQIVPGNQNSDDVLYALESAFPKAA